MLLSDIAESILDFLYPRLCPSCENVLLKREPHLCLECQFNLPLISFLSLDSNPVTEVFKTKILEVRGMAFLAFRKSSKVQAMMHQIKYKGNKDLAVHLGALFAKHVKNQLNTIPDLLVVAVPLHKEKLKKRGYNQSECIAKGFATELNAASDFEVLKRIHFADSQTTKGRYDRWDNLQGNFEVKMGSDLTGKRVILIDDVLTTGSTLERCSMELKKAGAREVLMAPLCVVIG